MDDKHIAREIRVAIKLGDVDKVSSLIGHAMARLDILTPFGTWLHVASAHGQLEIVKLLLNLGIDININGGISGGGPLNEAASEGHIEIVKYLLSNGAKLDVTEPEKNPLFSAIHGGHVAIAKLLIDKGIDTHVKYSGSSMTNMDALAFARERGQDEIAKMLS
jgi:ankyrin repeat protein